MSPFEKKWQRNLGKNIHPDKETRQRESVKTKSDVSPRTMGGECGIKMEANSYQNETNEDASHGKVSQASPIDSRDPEPSLDPA